MGSIQAVVLRETTQRERRVAVVPRSVPRLLEAGIDILVESRAGRAAGFPDSAYIAAGAEVLPSSGRYERADVLLTVGIPSPLMMTRLRAGQMVVGMLGSDGGDRLIAEFSQRGVTALSLDRVPRALERAASMDALRSQARIAGYKAVVLAANAFERFIPMVKAPDGEQSPAGFLVLGAGAAGLQAIDTARRLGATVTAYDIDADARREAASLGADIVQPTSRLELANVIGRHDIVIAAAGSAGLKPPLLVTAEAMGRMAAGSIVVDLAVGRLGGNVERAGAGRSTVTKNNVTVIGAGNLSAAMPEVASTAYSHNVTALLSHLVRGGELIIDPGDEICAAVVVARPGPTPPSPRASSSEPRISSEPRMS